MRYAVIRDGMVQNVVLWDGQEPWNPGDEYTVIDCPPEVGVGWSHDDHGFQAPPPRVIVEDPA